VSKAQGDAKPHVVSTVFGFAVYCLRVVKNMLQVTARALFNYDAANDEEVATGTAHTSHLTPHTSHLNLTPHVHVDSFGVSNH